jgi:hypothetical protein
METVVRGVTLGDDATLAITNNDQLDQLFAQSAVLR